MKKTLFFFALLLTLLSGCSIDARIAAEALDAEVVAETKCKQ